MNDCIFSVTPQEPGATCDPIQTVTRKHMTILVQNGNNRIIQHEDGSLVPQSAENGMWLYCYYQDSLPVVVAPTDAGRGECEAWAGLSLKREEGLL